MSDPVAERVTLDPLAAELYRTAKSVYERDVAEVRAQLQRRLGVILKPYGVADGAVVTWTDTGTTVELSIPRPE